MLYRIVYDLVTEASAQNSDYAQSGFVSIDGDEVAMTDENREEMQKDARGMYLHNLTGKGDIDFDLDLYEGDLDLFNTEAARACDIPLGYLYKLADIRHFIGILQENPGDYEPYNGSSQGFQFIQNIPPWEADETLPDVDENGEAIESPVLCRTLTYFPDKRDGLTEDEFKLVSGCIRKARVEVNAIFRALLRSKRIAILQAQLAGAQDEYNEDERDLKAAETLYRDAIKKAETSALAVNTIERQLKEALASE